MTNEQQEQIPYKKTLYDKILESQGNTDEGDTNEEEKAEQPEVKNESDNAGNPDNQDVSEPLNETTNEPDYSWAEVDDEPVVPGNNNRQKRLNIMFIVLFSILFGVIAYLIYVLSTERVESEEMKVTLEMQKENLTGELNELYAAYDTLQTNNDSMNILIQDRQDQIRNLLAVRASNAKKIQIYDKQLKSLRGVLKSYIVQVDSLNQANLRLQAENKASRDQIKQATSANRALEKNIKSLEGQVEKASVVKALFVQAEPIDNNGNIARKIKRTDKIRVNFALAENAIAKRGLKQIYVRIANPNERIMVKNAANVFMYQDESIPYSAMREVEYEGVELDVSIFYDAGDGEIVSGTYYVDLYMDGELVGTTSFSLR